MDLVLIINSKTDEFVTLFAGDNPQKFVVHKEFACHYSPVLKAAFNSNFIEGQTQTYRLEDTSVDALRLLLYWFYTQIVDTSEVDPFPLPQSDFEKNEDGRTKLVQLCSHLVELWVLAGSLIIPALQNMAMKEIVRGNGPSTGIATHCINYVYEKTTSGSPLRLFFVDLCACWLSEKAYLASPSRFPQEMLLDLVTVFSRHVNRYDMNARVNLMDISRYQVAED
jgi:hypothetical protein